MLFTYAIITDSIALRWFEQYDYAENIAEHGSRSVWLYVISKNRSILYNNVKCNPRINRFFQLFSISISNFVVRMYLPRSLRVDMRV